MNESELPFLSIQELAPLLAKRKLSPVELLDAMLGRIERLNGRLNAYLTVTAEQARREAQRAEREILDGRWRGPLHGIPISLKDNIWTRGVRTTAGSKVLADFVPGEDATVVRRLRRAGAVLIGKTNLHEFAYGVTTNNPHFGPTRNPWDLERIPGGSSGGSAAAIAAGMCVASIGTDTGGSIRIPAALCGLVGLKPTYGRVSCYGVVPLARTFDHVGPLTRTVADAAVVLEVIAGRDSRDSTTVRGNLAGLLRQAGRSVRGMKVGWPREYFFERLDPEVTRAINETRRVLQQLGVSVLEISLPNLDESVEPSGHIAYAEALHAHRAAGWYPERRADYSEETRKRIGAGLEVRAADYLRAVEFQGVVRAGFDAAFQEVDAIVAPTVPLPAPRIGEETVTLGGERETVRSALIRLNRPANFTGLPAVSVPCGFTESGLPLGLQIIGQALDEGRLLRVAAAYERAADWHKKRPNGI